MVVYTLFLLKLDRITTITIELSGYDLLRNLNVTSTHAEVRIACKANFVDGSSAEGNIFHGVNFTEK